MAVKKKGSVIDMINRRINEMERWLDNFDETGISKPSWNGDTCSIDPLKTIRVDANQVKITVDMPFVKEHSLIVKLVGRDTVEISASMKRVMRLHELGIKYQEAELKKFHCMARIPVPVDTKRMETSFKKGLLKVCIPRVRQTLKAKSTKRVK